ncbi:type II toxin-antitoxin system VapC family toxin [Acidisphaera sp. L21]|uniref:type II toxin-antitoxin system VapC family toxin n=1 Tax=Acidisphaera sp. L21 TaxID=1641851 RepID=UPI00131E0751|nr:type II toxin-antitoxin system VapC family toxin [Acidisphaera sp. L21]
MRLLLDTHALLWWLSDDAQLGSYARELIADPANEILVSVVSLWEIQVKVRVGKLAADMRDILNEIEAQALDLLPIDLAHLLCLAALPAHHRDPFDHLLIAQAITEGATFMSEDRHIPEYQVPFLTCSGS